MILFIFNQSVIFCDTWSIESILNFMLAQFWKASEFSTPQIIKIKSILSSNMVVM